MVISSSVNLTSGPDTVSGSGLTINATSGTLSLGDLISGGGSSTLDLLGGGIFDLRNPTVLTGIPTLNAQEGQASFGGTPGTAQVIYLRDGLDLTVNVADDPSPNPANPRGDGIEIFGANNADVINLGTGTNSVLLGSASEVVHGGAGNDTVVLTTAMLGATLDGGGGKNLLKVTGGGTGVMGASITDFQVVQLANAGSPYDFTANDTAGLRIISSSANDTLRAGAGGDTLWGHSGDIFVLNAVGSDLVQGSAAELNATTIQNFSTASGQDAIDIVDFHSPGSVSTAFSPGVLTVTEAGAPQSVTIALPGIIAGGFSATSDGHGGTTLAYVLPVAVALTKSSDTVAGGLSGVALTAGPGTLTKGDVIDGGTTGASTLTLQGSGTFDLRLPKTLANVQTLFAQEGQPTYAPGGIASNAQIIYLRDGLNLTVDVADDPSPNPANPNGDRIQIFGANNADVINLGNGTNSVALGSASEVVHGGAGSDTVVLATSMLGATLDGGGGGNLLDVTGGGTGVMGASITNFQLVQLQNAASAYDFTANNTTGLRIVSSSANDTIRAGTGGDTLWGHSGDTFVLNAVGNDTVQGSAAQLNGTTIQNFSTVSGQDVIDIVDFHTPGSVTASLSGGVLTITEAGNPQTVAINLPGSGFGTFTASSDGHGGTKIIDPAVSLLAQSVAGTGAPPPGGTSTGAGESQSGTFLLAHA